MATTMYNTTVSTIVNGALRINGAIAQGESASSAQQAEALEALNMMLTAFQADGMPLWAITESTLTLTTTNNYELGYGLTVDIEKPLRIQQAFLRNINTNIDIPMRLLTRDEYNRLGNKTSSGLPIQFYYTPKKTSGTLYLFPTPDATAVSDYEVHIVYQRPFTLISAITDVLDFPNEWLEAIKFGLADRLSLEYGLDMLERQEIKKRAEEYKNNALSFGSEEGSLFFQVDHRSW